MSKVLQFVLVLVTVLVCGVVSARAWTQEKTAQPIYGADCRGRLYESYLINHPEVQQDYDCSVNVYVFDDANNKCYIVKGSNASGISCLKSE